MSGTGVKVTRESRLKRWLGLSSFVVTSLWIYFWEWIRSQVYERVQRTLTPYLEWLTLDHIARFGPPVIFAALGFWLFWKTRPEQSTIEDREEKTIGSIGYISEARLVPSGEKMSLVVTPSRGGVVVSIFVEISQWRPSLIPTNWSEIQRFYLGEMQLRAANVKFSIDVMERPPDTGIGWLWNILKSNGQPSGTLPWLVQGRQRVVFVFIDPNGNEEKFPLLLVQPATNTHPLVIAPSDLPIIVSTG